MNGGNPGFAVYVHWPFCETVCPYCDFNVHAQVTLDHDIWRQALLRDLDHVARDTPGRTLTSLYFGGGTPSLMPPGTVAALIERAAGHWSFTPDIEITLETNPTSGETDRLQAFKQAGVNRLSVGLQSLNDRTLTFLGRTHDATQGRHALERARNVFDRLTFDLMYALPEQSLDDWQNELLQALALAQGHLSLYQLTIESGTPFSKNRVKGAEDDLAADMFELTQRILEDAGYPAYEVSNHARPGDESRHNLTCWRGGDYLGIGPGAHGRLTIDGQTYGTHQIHNPARWLDKTQTEGHGTAKRRPLTGEDRARELVMMGLRLNEGIWLESPALQKTVDAETVDRLVDAGLLVIRNGRLSTTQSGRLTLNAVLREILI